MKRTSELGADGATVPRELRAARGSWRTRLTAPHAGVLVLVLLAFASQPAQAAEPDPRSGIVDCTSDILQMHNPNDLAGSSTGLYCFEGYLSKFKEWEATTRNTKEAWGIPQFTVHSVKGMRPRQKVIEGRKRPPSWFSVPKLQEAGAAPVDANYRFTLSYRKSHPNWYERGHLTQKYLAERLNGTAGWFTHNVINAVPQKAIFNKGPWLTLECLTGAWANEYGEVWIITGPIFLNGEPTQWLESNSTKRPFAIAIPDALFKIVVRKSQGSGWDTLAFVYPQDADAYRVGPWNPATWLTSVARVELLTGEKFSPLLKPADNDRDRRGRLWTVKKVSFDPSCKKFSREIS